MKQNSLKEAWGCSQQDYPSERLEVIAIDGMSTDGTKTIVQHLKANTPISVALLENPKLVVTTALNIGIPMPAEKSLYA